MPSKDREFSELRKEIVQGDPDALARFRRSMTRELRTIVRRALRSDRRRSGLTEKIQDMALSLTDAESLSSLDRDGGLLDRLTRHLCEKLIEKLQSTGGRFSKGTIADQGEPTTDQRTSVDGCER